MGIAMFPEGDPAVAEGGPAAGNGKPASGKPANGKPVVELSGQVTGQINGVDYQSSRPSQGKYRPVSAAFAIAPTVSVVIPVKNEARNLPIVFRTVPAWVDEVVLVDGRSVDDTLAVARRCRPDVKIVHQVGKGKGDALLAGFAACSGDIIVMIDGDGSTDGAEIIRFVAALVAGADYAKGSRFASSGGSDDINVVRQLGNRILCGMVNLAFRTRYTDLCYGYNAFWARHLPALGLDCLGFEIETMMNIRVAKAGLRIQEVPSHEFRRVHGVSNLSVFVDGWRILKVITVEAFRHRIKQRRTRKPVTVPAAETAQTAEAAAVAGGPLPTTSVAPGSVAPASVTADAGKD